MPAAKTKNRAKSKPPPQALLGSLEALDMTLQQIGECGRCAHVYQAECDQRVSDLLEQYAAKTGPLDERAEELRTIIQASAEAHPEWFDKARSAAVPHGRIGWRKVKAIKFLKKVATVVAALRRRRLSRALIVKTSVNKDVLATYPDPVLAAVGAKRVERDQFYVDLEPETT